MRRAEANTIERAIHTYAVMLNRPQWLDEHRFDLQVGVWNRLVSADTRPGLVDVDDFEEAIDHLLSFSRPIDVMPSQIITHATNAAHIRQRYADELLAQLDHHPDMFMYRERVTIAEVGGAPEIQGDLRRLERDRIVAKALNAAMRSTLDEPTVARLVSAIEKLSANEQLRLPA